MPNPMVEHCRSRRCTHDEEQDLDKAKVATPDQIDLVRERQRVIIYPHCCASNAHIPVDFESADGVDELVHFVAWCGVPDIRVAGSQYATLVVSPNCRGDGPACMFFLYQTLLFVVPTQMQGQDAMDQVNTMPRYI
jgi:hypothetical protein